MHNTLESHKLFPYVAWALFIGFAIFTYTLAVRLQENFGEIDTNVTDLERRIEQLEDKQNVP